MMCLVLFNIKVIWFFNIYLNFFLGCELLIVDWLFGMILIIIGFILYFKVFGIIYEIVDFKLGFFFL